MKKNRNSLWLILGLLLAACSSGAAPEVETAVTEPEPTVEIVKEPTAEPEPQTISLTDGLGNTVELEAPAQKIISLELRPTEKTVEIDIGITVHRLDFAAKIETDEGYKTALIEIQKAKFPTDIMRFRKYLGKQYESEKNANP